MNSEHRSVPFYLQLHLLSKYTKEDDQEKRNKHIDRIKDSVKHLNDILEDFLSLGKLDEGRISTDPHEFNLPEMIAETLAEVKVVLKPGQKFNFKYEGDGKDKCR